MHFKSFSPSTEADLLVLIWKGMPPSKKKRWPATMSQSKSLVETEAIDSGLALNFFFLLFFSGETRSFNNLLSSLSSLFLVLYLFFSLLFLVVDLSRKGRTKCIVGLFDFSFSRPVQIHSRPQSPSFLGHVVGKRGALEAAVTGCQKISDIRSRMCKSYKYHCSCS